MKNIKKLLVFTLFTTIMIACSKDESDNGSCGDKCAYTFASGDVAGTTPTSLEGTYNLTMQYAKPSSPYPDGTKGIFTILNDELKVEIEGTPCITISNPILTSPGGGSDEIQFIDNCRDEILYAVSRTQTGKLNEINISNLSGTWFGQFHE